MSLEPDYEKNCYNCQFSSLSPKEIAITRLNHKNTIMFKCVHGENSTRPANHSYLIAECKYWEQVNGK